MLQLQHNCLSGSLFIVLKCQGERKDKGSESDCKKNKQNENGGD